MSRRITTLSIVSGTLIVIACMILANDWFISRDTERQPTYEPDLTNHPIYSTYEFAAGEDVINIGTQPLYLPTGFITEVMKRDLLLKEALVKYNLKLQFYSFLKGDDVNFFLKKGDLQAGVGGDMPALSIAASTEVIIPALIQQGYCSIVAKRSMIIQELKGARVGYAFGSNAHYALLRALESGNLTESEVTLIPFEVMDMPEALESGKIDAFSAWEPTPTISLINYSPRVIVHRNLSSGYLYFHKDLITNKKEAAHHIVAAEIRALRWLQKEKRNLYKASEWVLRESKGLSSRRIDLSVEIIEKLAYEDILKTTSTPFIPKSYLTPDGLLYNEFMFLKALGKISPSCKWEKIFNSFDRQIMQKIISYPERYNLNEYNYEFNRVKNGQ